MADEGSGWAISKTNSWLQELLKKNRACKGSQKEKIDQVLSSIQVLCLKFEKTFFTSYCLPEKNRDNL